MVVHGSIRRGLAVAGAVVALAAGVAESAQAAVYENPHAPTYVRVKDLLWRMTLPEKIGQMTQAERGARRRRPDADHHARLGSRALRRRLDADAEHARRRGPTWSTASRARRSHAPAHPAALRHRRRARRRQRARRDGLPAQHRPRRHARPGARARTSSTSPPRRRARPGRSGRSRRASASRATTAGAARTRASARTRAWSMQMETAIDGFQGAPGQLADADRVLATAKHYAGDGDTQYGTGDRRLHDRPGHHDHQPARTSGDDAAAPVRAGGPASTTSAASCRRSPASTGPRTASATRSRCTPTRS